MSTELSIAQILANLEKEMALHKEQADHHAEKEAFHREQRVSHTAEYEAIAKHYEAFKTSAGAAAEIAARVTVTAAPKVEPPPPVTRKQPKKLVARLIAELPAGEVYTPSQIADEVNRRYRNELKKPLIVPTASTILRRMLLTGEVRLVRSGTAHVQAVYTKR